MMNTFKAHIYAADRVFFEGDCESMIVPTEDGQYGIWAGHSNVISAVVPGIMTFRVPGKKDEIAAVSSGLVKIENNDVLLLVDSAEHPEDIDIKRAQHAADAAKEAEECVITAYLVMVCINKTCAVVYIICELGLLLNANNVAV